MLCYIYVINIYAFDTMCYGNYRYFDAVPKFTVSCKIYIDVFVDVIKQRNFAYNVCKNAYLMWRILATVNMYVKYAVE